MTSFLLKIYNFIVSIAIYLTLIKEEPFPFIAVAFATLFFLFRRFRFGFTFSRLKEAKKKEKKKKQFFFYFLREHAIVPITLYRFIERCSRIHIRLQVHYALVG